MYIKDQFVTVFNSNLKGSDKVTVKNLSISEKKTDGTYESESWTGRFVGKAKEVVDAVPEKTRLKISGNVHAGYNKEKKQNYPYILVTVAEVLESKAAPAEEKKADDLPDVDW